MTTEIDVRKMNRRERERFIKKHLGLLSECARDLEVAVSHVNRVFHGKSTSARVLRHIERKMRQAEQRTARA